MCPIDLAQKAFARPGTLLCTDDTDDGSIYWSTPSLHAEEIFIIKTKHQDLSNIETIWIKNSPCIWCAEELIKHFARKPKKPTIYIGKIWNGRYGDESTNKEGLKKMKRNGFHLTAWYAPGIIRHSSYTKYYLKSL